MQSVAFSIEGSAFIPQLPEPMFEIKGSERLPGAPDISSDGKHFILSMPVDDDDATARREPTIILNWMEEVKARVPTGARP